MPIISKETWEKFTQEEKSQLKELWEENDKYCYGMYNKQLEKLFGKEQLQPQPLTYEDVARELFGENLELCHSTSVPCAGMKWDNKLQAIGRLLVVAKFLNGDWKPDWSYGNEEKWFIYIEKEDRVCTDGCDFLLNEGKVYFRTEELARQAVEILGEDTVRLALSTDW